MATSLRRTPIHQEAAPGNGTPAIVAPALLGLAVFCHALPWEAQVAGVNLDAKTALGFVSLPYGPVSAALTAAAAACLLYLALASVDEATGRIVRWLGWALAGGALVTQMLATFVSRGREGDYQNGASTLRIIYKVTPAWGLYVAAALTAVGLVLAVLPYLPSLPLPGQSSAEEPPERPRRYYRSRR